MHPSPATVVALLLVVAAASLIALTAIAVRPTPQGPTVRSQAAPGAQPRVHGRDPSSARRTPRRGAGRRTARPAARPTPVPTAVPETLVTETPHQEAAVTPPAQRQDRSSCGPVRRTFAVRWRLEADGDGWRAASLTGVKRTGPEPAEACPERQNAARAAGGR